MATVYNFSATQGSQLSVRLNVKDASGDAIDLSGYSSRGVVKYRYSSTNTLSGNLITTGQTLQTQITSNDTDITNLTTNLVTTGQTLTTNLVTTGNFLDSEIGIVSGIAESHTDITELSGNLITTGQTLTSKYPSHY